MAFDKGMAVVTGASAGIGALYAEGLARRGHDLLLVARRRDKLKTVAERIGGTTGRTVESLALDLANPEDLERLEDRLATDASIDTLINNAGAGEYGSLAEADISRIDTMLALNVIAVTGLTRAVLPRLMSRGSGTIVNVASIQAMLVRANNAAYGASKAYVLNFTESVRLEVEAKGLGERILIQALLPGATATDFWGTAGVALESLPPSIVMSGEDFVEAALTGLDLREPVCIPGLPDAAAWATFRDTRLATGQASATNKPAARYVI